MLLLGKIVLGVTGVALAGAGALCSDGFVQVDVNGKTPQGHHIYVIAPAMLAPIAVRLAPRYALAQTADQMQPNMPVIRAVLSGLRGMDDGVIVEVKEPGEHVQVSKAGGSIVVDVDDPGETVHVSAPIRAISSAVEQLAADTSNPI
ncbi:MAG: hypothetical protein WBQ34_04370 [Candidatus Acidiferrales bacterium]